LTFSVIDVVFISLIGLLMIRAFLRGFVKELFSMAGIVIGLYAAVFFYGNGAAFLRSRFWPDMQIIPEIVSFISLFLIILIIVKLLEKLLTDIINRVSLTGADSVLGLVFGLLEGVLLVCLIILVLNLIKPYFDTNEILSGSFFVRIFSPLIFSREELPLTEVPNV